MDTEALAALLESRRALIDPGTVPGLRRTEGQGRRARGRGLSQEQVDLVTLRVRGTYNKLVKGKTKSPGFDYLRSVAGVLRFTEQEWVALCRYARGEDPPAPLHPRSGQEVPGMWRDAIAGITHMAYVTDQSYNLLAHNAPFAGLFPHTAPPRNMLDWMLFSAEGRHALTNWETAWAPYVLPQLRAARAALPHDAVLARIERDVIADPECGRLYEERVTAQVHPDGQERPLLHPTLGPCWVQICAAEPLSSPNSRVMIVMVYPGVSHSQVRRSCLRALWITRAVLAGRRRGVRRPACPRRLGGRGATRVSGVGASNVGGSDGRSRTRGGRGRHGLVIGVAARAAAAQVAVIF